MNNVINMFLVYNANSYVVGTEEGPIHKCSCSYNEQYLDTFLGHTVRFALILLNLSLSCFIHIFIREALN